MVRLLQTGLYYMGRDLCTAAGIQGSIVLSKALYWKTLEALNEADFMAVHTCKTLSSISFPVTPLTSPSKCASGHMCHRTMCLRLWVSPERHQSRPQVPSLTQL